MFDMGLTEMMLIGIVALVVIGPERLPGVARTAGKYVGRLKRFMTTVKADVEQELRADELREILSQQQKELDSLKDTISDAGKEISDAGKDIEQQADDMTKSWGEPSAAAAAVGKPATAESSTSEISESTAEAESVAKKPATKKTATRKPAAKKAVAKKAATKKTAGKAKT